VKIADTSAIKSAINIESYVDQYVKLRNGYGLCPFHSEKSPSFHVNGREGYYKCFGCGVGGDVITFASQYHSLSIGAAIRMLADECGVQPQSITVKAPTEARTLAIEASVWWGEWKKALLSLRNEHWTETTEALYDAHMNASRQEVVDTYRRIRTPWLGEQMRNIHRKESELASSLRKLCES
jgi:hypothetical protein